VRSASLQHSLEDEKSTRVVDSSERGEKKGERRAEDEGADIVAKGEESIHSSARETPCERKFLSRFLKSEEERGKVIF